MYLLTRERGARMQEKDQLMCVLRHLKKRSLEPVLVCHQKLADNVVSVGRNSAKDKDTQILGIGTTIQRDSVCNFSYFFLAGYSVFAMILHSLDLSPESLS